MREKELTQEAARQWKPAGPYGVRKDSPIFQVRAPTNTTSGCINYWFTQEVKNELGKDREMKTTVSSSAVFSFANVPACEI